MRLILSLGMSLALTLPAFAVGSDDDSTPTPTETTMECSDGQIWDADTEACVDAEDARLDDNTLYRAVREFAYAWQPLNAQRALAAMSDQSEDRVQTYWGFTHRQLGDWDRAEAAYLEAITGNPANLLARAYYGMGLLDRGEVEAARLQLTAITDHGGAGSWPELALSRALRTGQSANY